MPSYFKCSILCLILTHKFCPTPLQTQTSQMLNTSLPVFADPAQQDPHSDTLGVIRCYCMSRNWHRDGPFGFYYLWDYYNLHTKQRFLLERTCYSNGWATDGWLKAEQWCLRFHDRDKICLKDHAGDKYCYELNGKEAFDRFSYNHQKRGLPPNSYKIQESGSRVLERCNTCCYGKVGRDMRMLEGRAIRYANAIAPNRDRLNWRDNEWSHIAFYPEVDDMCYGCK